jgi:hypothetical protein
MARSENDRRRVANLSAGRDMQNGVMDKRIFG